MEKIDGFYDVCCWFAIEKCHFNHFNKASVDFLYYCAVVASYIQQVSPTMTMVMEKRNLLSVKLKCVYFLIISYGRKRARENKKSSIKVMLPYSHIQRTQSVRFCRSD